MNSEIILDILQAIDKISSHQAEEARKFSSNSGKSVRQSLVELGFVKPLEIAKALAYQFGMELVQLDRALIDPEVIKCIPRDIAYKYQIVPVKLDNDLLTVAISDPLALDILENLRFELNLEVDGIVAMEEEIQTALERYYGAEEGKIDNLLKDIQDGGISIAGEDDVLSDNSDEHAENDDAPVIKLVSMIISEAFRRKASDIHIEPMERKLRIRYRIDGILQEIPSPPKRLQGSVISRIKIMANLDMAERRLPQDGRIKVKVGKNKTIDLRVSTLPANHGESVVLRILDKSGLTLGLTELGFFNDDEALISQLINMPNGIMLITGPTGSGKTTTLYSCLHVLNKPDRKIITVEDPVEYVLSGINQVQVRSEIGLSFASVLRSCLRQAPNVIMVGEIRDLETAEIAVNASLTGHLVFSTLHTNDASGAVTRLIDQGVKPFLVASSVRAILAQRLVRCICSNCKESYTPSMRELELLGIPANQANNVVLYRGAGCANCGNSGYKGRKGIFEILIMSDEIQRLVYQKAPSSQIRTRAREMGMRTLREDGLRKALSGMTTLTEILRITQSYDD
ncbi:MAG: type II secretion system protein GspE [Candidatus Auribacter fodinae]|jgi:general secretion pathway protein E/type IV pilus assembly protein PilB|uniref:protein-secreting ATPase n=1 Tax=Candidatus Auribacter fodinae TaxID=2093366 RepID=A0A3A4R9H2_9BACT|nr:MAG: type II secretion system protein GspE [Candidatus Auribacter fodinae]